MLYRMLRMSCVRYFLASLVSKQKRLFGVGPQKSVISADWIGFNRNAVVEIICIFISLNYLKFNFYHLAEAGTLQCY